MGTHVNKQVACAYLVPVAGLQVSRRAPRPVIAGTTFVREINALNVFFRGWIKQRHAACVLNQYSHRHSSGSP